MVKQQVLWSVLEEYEMPLKIINIIKNLYIGCECRILHRGNMTEVINIGTGVRHGCILSPTSFLILFWLDSDVRFGHEEHTTTEEKESNGGWVGG